MLLKEIIYFNFRSFVNRERKAPIETTVQWNEGDSSPLDLRYKLRTWARNFLFIVIRWQWCSVNFTKKTLNLKFENFSYLAIHFLLVCIKYNLISVLRWPKKWILHSYDKSRAIMIQTRSINRISIAELGLQEYWA